IQRGAPGGGRIVEGPQPGLGEAQHGIDLAAGLDQRVSGGRVPALGLDGVLPGDRGGGGRLHREGPQRAPDGGHEAQQGGAGRGRLLEEGRLIEICHEHLQVQAAEGPPRLERGVRGRAGGREVDPRRGRGAG
ncbi:MAG: hypothetical protein ACK559_16565, partial [bacterium]